ncbi:MAG TPA: alpha/beta fold hydrolase [Candidatus Binataceae bacterium]|jgi:pimeloyl-ACP methyl ester carboxylesterase|nr:alpha/beta fold hydrolase [Candidatus Binataceae bacterium]
MATANVNGIRIHYQVEGAGPPLLLISGLGQNSLSWAPIVPMLRDTFSCITFDNRGTGRSDVPPGPYTIDQMSDDAAALIEHLKVGPVSAVGWSLGGSVLQSMLIRHRDQLKCAVLLSAFPSYTELQHRWLDCRIALQRSGVEPLSQTVFGAAWVFTPRWLSNHTAAVATAKLGLKDPYPTSIEGFEAQAHGLRRYDARPALPTVTTPTLVVVGAEDILTPVEQSAEIARLIPGAKLQVLPRGGHGMALEYTSDTVRAIRAFLTAKSRATVRPA